MLVKPNRLSKSVDIERVARQGRSFFSKHAGVKFVNNHQRCTRFAIIISLKISKKAVIRNKLKRQIRNIIYKSLASIKPGLDIIILTKPVLVDLGFDNIKQEIQYLFKQAGLLN